jgi:hypothetical protein
MSDRKNAGVGFCSAELDRLTAAEISIDEVMTIYERHGIPISAALKAMSKDLDDLLHTIDGTEGRYQRLGCIRLTMTEAFPICDEDLETEPQS